MKDVLYVASAEVGGDDASAIEAFNAKTLEWISMIDDGPGLDWVTAAQGAMGIGRMRISRDGKMLGLTVDEGVKDISAAMIARLGSAANPGKVAMPGVRLVLRRCRANATRLTPR